MKAAHIKELESSLTTGGTSSKKSKQALAGGTPKYICNARPNSRQRHQIHHSQPQEERCTNKHLHEEHSSESTNDGKHLVSEDCHTVKSLVHTRYRRLHGPHGVRTAYSATRSTTVSPRKGGWTHMHLRAILSSTDSGAHLAQLLQRLKICDLCKPDTSKLSVVR